MSTKYGASVQDSLIFGNILSTAESSAVWNDRTRTQYYLFFEASLAKAQARLGIISPEDCDAIVKCCTIEIVDWDLLRTKTELIGYPVLGVVQQLVARVDADTNGRRGESAHFGATTQDVTDTATILQLRDTFHLLEKSLNSIIEACKKLSKKYKGTPMAARSNLQQAVPISFGFKIARLLSTFLRHRARLSELHSRLLVLEFSGAAGTLATLSPNGSDDIGLRCQTELAKELDLSVPEIAWHTERDRIAEAGQWMALTTSTCAKFAFDVKLMMQTEVGEVSEPYVKHRGSSSTMPQKRNPISCAYISACNATVRQLSGALLEAVIEDHERSTGPWEIEWIVLPQICTLSHCAMEKTRELLEGLEVHEGAMRRNLDISQGAICSEAVMMGLAESVGRQKAHDLIYDLCREAIEQDRPLVDLLDESPDVPLSRAELERLCDPSNYLGLSETMVDRVLQQEAEGKK